MKARSGVPGLQQLMQDDETAGVGELRALLGTLLGESAEILEERMIWRSRVYRVRFRCQAETRSLILKRLPPDRAYREQLVLRQWLPRLDLGQHGSPLVGVAAAATGETVWHVYDDLGEHTLDRREGAQHAGQREPEPESMPARDRLLAAIEAIARIHRAFSTCGFLGEVRQYGIDLGLPFLATGLRDVMMALDVGRERFPGRDEKSTRVLERLRERLQALRDEEPERTRMLAIHGGPETLLHGDLWTCNVMVLPSSSGSVSEPAPSAAGTHSVRLIDWDHAGVGFVSYDLSAFLLRFPVQERQGVLEAYAEQVGRAGWTLPEASTLNALFDTAERARVVSSLLWPALAYRENGADWALEQLAEVERWFEALGPVLPLD
jgi:hypothetical protein